MPNLEGHQILQEFLETFETAHAMRNNDAPNYVVTKEEFEEWYNNCFEMDSNLRPKLKSKGLLTRDSRIKESKKYGLKRARKAQQFTKR